MDKFFLLTYTCAEADGFRHSKYAWFETADDMRKFLACEKKKGKKIETDVAIEIVSHREIRL